MSDDFTSCGHAPAPPFSYPTWTAAAKDAVGCALGTSRLWFTCAEGIVTEVYYPRIDIPQLKDLGFIVADGQGFWVEVRRLNSYQVQWEDGAIPAFTITHRHDRFTLTLRICPDPYRDVLLIHFHLAGDSTLRAYWLAAPRLGEDAVHSQAAVSHWEGRPVLWAEQGPFGLAITAIDTLGRVILGPPSVGMVGASDLWQDFHQHGAMTWHYAEAGPGEVALAAQLSQTLGTLAIGFGSSKETAATLAFSALTEGFSALWTHHCALWRTWHRTLPAVFGPAGLAHPHSLLLRRSATVLKIHIDRTFPGALVASLSIPWGATSQSRAGYHLVWSRDLVESAAALVALGAWDDARAVLIYLMATQQADGHWLQNQWLGGKPFWQGIQLDETGFPVLLAGLLADRDALAGIQVADMVRRALMFIVENGPVTCQDRWEEDSGINTYTMAVVIAALVEGARFLAPRERDCALLVADYWNHRLEDWTWARDTTLARKLDVDGYYMRIAPPEILVRGDAKTAPMLIKNRAHTLDPVANEQVSTDFLQLCRFGLRDPKDPRIVASLRVIDALLKTDTPTGPVWHRYNGDGYGEHPDGAPFDGWGRGRGWPLLTGERGHHALLAGEDPQPYVDAMAAMTGTGGMLPEQVWDADPIPERGLFPGRPSGSAMPLVWAHSEFIKLVLSMGTKTPVDRPQETWRRYGGKRPHIGYQLWRFHQPITTLKRGQDLHFVLSAPTVLHYGHDGWQDPRDIRSEDWGLAHITTVKATELGRYRRIDFTFFWPADARWEGEDFHIDISPS